LFLLKAQVATVSMQSSAPIARKPGRRHFLGQLYPGRFPSDFLYRIPVKDYGERAGDIVSAIRALRRAGMRVGLPHQTADGVMFFQLDDYTLTVAQILELLDENRLDREGIRALAEARKKMTT
jgi:hypothetical protein